MPIDAETSSALLLPGAKRILKRGGRIGIDPVLILVILDPLRFCILSVSYP